MKHASKLVAMAMAVLMLTALFAPAGLAEATMPELPDNTLKLNVSIPNFNIDPTGTPVQLKWQEMMEEYLGVKLDITYSMTPWADYRTNEKVLIQAGEIADVATYSQGTYINEFGADGMVLNIMDYWDYLTYYPQYAEATNGAMNYITTADGASYYFFDGYYNPNNITGAQSFTSFAYRFDLLREHDLQPATTMEEFDKLCADIQALIDSGEISAKYVMSNSTKDYAFYRGFVGIFHTWDTTYWNGEKWSFGPIEDNFRTMLTYLNGLYNQGYIDPEFSTDTSDMVTDKALNDNMVIVPTLWSGMPRSWNLQKTNPDMEWGLAFLPAHADYGTPWKWGSRQVGKSLSENMGIIISADVQYPEWIVKMIDYQYSDEIVNMMNWGIEGETFTIDADGQRHFTENISGADDPVQAAGELGIMSSSANRPGIPFVPQLFDAATELMPLEPWWNAEDGYYESQYWLESGRLGGEESVSPFDRPPVLRLTESEATARAEMTSACELYAREQALKFINGELDISDDAAWESYIAGIKSQVADFDGVFETLQAKSVLD